MSSLIIVPSRGRPQNVERLVGAFVDTDAWADLLIAVDEDDEFNYPRLQDACYEVVPSQRIGPTINTLAVRYAGEYDYLGFMGDDHLPRTDRWDRILADRIGGFGVAYGDDLLMGEAIPSAVLMSSNIVEVLGYMVPPGLWHLYFDNTWKVWGLSQERLFYTPEVIIEHLHPLAKKTNWDVGYTKNNSAATLDHDRSVFFEYMQTEFIKDVRKLDKLAR